MEMTPEELAEIRRMHAAGMSLKAIGREFGRSWVFIRYRLDPKYIERRRERRARLREVNHTGKLHFEHPEPVSIRDTARRLALESPQEDTRSLTARLLGDPIPGDRRRQA